MILGIGVDIVEIARIQKALATNGEAFAKRVLADAEWAEYAAHPEPARFLAKRWAIKEAFGKACGVGVRAPFTLHAMNVLHTEMGAPYLMLDAGARAWLHAQGSHRWHISVSDERENVVAYALIELD